MIFPAAFFVDRPRHHFLARARFPLDEHRDVRGRDLLDQPLDIPDRLASPDKEIHVITLFEPLADRRIAGHESLVVERLADREHDLFVRSRPGHVVERPLVNRIHRRADRPPLAHEDELRVRRKVPQFRHQRNAVGESGAGRLDDDVEMLLRRHFAGGLFRNRRGHAVALAVQHPPDAGRIPGVTVNDQDGDIRGIHREGF